NMQLLPALIRGARILIGANLEASEFIALQKKNPTHTILVPSQVRLFWRRSNFHRLISPSLRTVVTGSAVVDEVVWRRLAAVFPRVIGVYGLTEMGPYVCTTESYISPREET